MADFFNPLAAQRVEPRRPLRQTRTEPSVGFTEPRIWQYLLIAVVALYLLAPTRLPLVPASAHGTLLSLVFLAHLLTRRGRIDLTLLLPFLLFFGSLALAVALSGQFVPGYLRTLLLGGIAAYLFAFYFRTPTSLRLYGTVLTILGLLATFRIAIVLAPPLLAWVPPSLHVLTSGLGDPILFGLFLLVGHLALAHMYVRSPKRLILAPLFIITLALIAAGSRAIWVGALSATLAYLGLMRAWRRGAIVLLVAELAFGGMFLLMLARVAGYHGGLNAAPPPIAYALDFTWKATASLKNRGDFSGEGRWVIAATGLRMWRRSPWVGVGPGKFAERFAEFLPAGQRPTIIADAEIIDPHSIYIAILTDGGVLGMAGFVGMLGLIVLQAWRRRWQGGEGSEEVALLLASVIGLCVVGLAHDVHLDRIWWIMLGLLHGQSFRRGQGPA